ncbi:MAG: nitroreductase family protein [Syntrophobacteraceae bacterium]
MRKVEAFIEKRMRGTRMTRRPWKVLCSVAAGYFVIFFIICSSSFGTGSLIPDACAEQQGPPQIAVTFKNPYGPVVFNHDVHKGHACSECHPPFDFKLDPGSGYSARAHGLCVSCHEKSAIATKCDSCHALHKRTAIPFDPAVMKGESGQKQEVLDFFFKRRSVRKFLERQVPDAVVRDLLKAAMAAPSAGNWQPWEFVVVKDEKRKTALAEASPFARFVKTAPVVICVAGNRNNHWAPFDCALAAENLLLAAANFELGATYCGLDNEREAKAREVLGIPDGYYLYALIPIGYPAESKKPHTKYNPDRIHWGHFEAGRTERVAGE